MKVIGLCGGSGSGKGTVAQIFARYGIISLDADLIYRDLTSHTTDCLDAIAAAFGGDVITKSGSLDRKKLSSLVFSGDEADERRKMLNSISHAFILEEIRKHIDTLRAEGVAAVIVDAPLLFESGFDSECDVIVCVCAERESRIRRIISRDYITREAAERRIDTQISDERLRTLSDYTIVNDGDVDELEKQVSEIAEEILNSEK